MNEATQKYTLKAQVQVGIECPAVDKLDHDTAKQFQDSFNAWLENAQDSMCDFLDGKVIVTVKKAISVELPNQPNVTATETLVSTATNETIANLLK